MNEKENLIDNKKINRVLVGALCIRLICLFLIFCFANNLETSFVSSILYYDDYRYEQGAIQYSKTAESLIDTEAFKRAYANVGDWVGYKLNIPFQSTPLWYWVCCILCKVFKTFWSIRLLNVIISTFSIIYIYKFGKLAFGEKTGILAAKLMAFLPYPVIFSCFSYKDHLVMLISFYLLYVAEKYRKTKHIKATEILKALCVATILMLTRSGLSIILFAVCLLIAFFEGNFQRNVKIKTQTLFIISVACFFIVVLLSKFSNIILFKLSYYLDRHENTLKQTNISFLAINSIIDLYKLPITYLFSVVMPIDLFRNIDSWYSIITNVNICMCPIAVGSAFYMISKKNDPVVFWSCFLLYFISIITSINIFRHYYSLIPLNCISFAAFYNQSSKKNKYLCMSISILYMISLIVFYLIK